MRLVHIRHVTSRHAWARHGTPGHPSRHGTHLPGARLHAAGDAMRSTTAAHAKAAAGCAWALGGWETQGPTGWRALRGAAWPDEGLGVAR